MVCGTCCIRAGNQKVSCLSPRGGKYSGVRKHKFADSVAAVGCQTEEHHKYSSGDSASQNSERGGIWI